MSRAGKGGPVVAGAAFAIAWTPCIGPTLGAILTAASLSSSAAHGAFLLAVYSAGLGIPFLVTALAFSRMTTAFAAVKRHYAAIMAVGGAILIAMGVLILTGEFFQLNIEAQKLTSDLGLNLATLSLLSWARGPGRRPRPDVPTASTSSSSPPSESREQTIRKRPVPERRVADDRQAADLAPSRGARSRTGSSAPPRRETGSCALCWSIAREIASRFLASVPLTAPIVVLTLAGDHPPTLLGSFRER